MTNILEFAPRSNLDPWTEEFAKRFYDAACKLEVTIRQIENLSWLLSTHPPQYIIEEAHTLIQITKDMKVTTLKYDSVYLSFEKQVSIFADHIISWINNDMIPIINFRNQHENDFYSAK